MTCIDGLVGYSDVVEPLASGARLESERDCKRAEDAPALHQLLAQDDFERARPIAERIFGGGDPARDDDRLAAAITTFGLIAWSEGRVADALGLLHAAVRRAGRFPWEMRPLHAHLALARTFVSIGEFDNADACVRAAQLEVDESGDIQSAAAPAIIDARIRLASGDLDAAMKGAEHGLDVAEVFGTHLMTPLARATLTVVALHRGDLRTAASHVARLRAEPRTRLGSGAPVYDWIEGRVREAQEGPERGLELLGWVYDDAHHNTRLFVEEPSAAPWLVRVALRADALARAAAVAGAAGLLAADNPSFGPLAAAALHTRGLLEQDADLIHRSALAYASPWDRASAWEDAAKVLLSSGEREAGRRALSGALAEYEQIGALRDAARARRTLGHRQEQPIRGWESLTDAERRVAEHVASGLTNREVAQRMYLSRHTIDFHLRQAFRKTGVRSRVQLTRLVLEQQIGHLARSGYTR